MFRQPPALRRSPLVGLVSLLLHGGLIAVVAVVGARRMFAPHVDETHPLTYLTFAPPHPPIAVPAAPLPKVGARGPLAGWAKNQIFDGPLASRGFFNESYINGLWQRHVAGVHDHSFDLWCLVNLGAWYSRWIDKPAAAA